MTNDQDILNGVFGAPANAGGPQLPAPNDGRIAPLDGNAAPVGARFTVNAHRERHAVPLQPDPSHPFGLNNERLEEVRPDLVNALRGLEVEYRQEGLSRDVMRFGGSGRRVFFGRACSTPGGIRKT
jgi:hypothetical protein